MGGAKIPGKHSDLNSIASGSKVPIAASENLLQSGCMKPRIKYSYCKVTGFIETNGEYTQDFQAEYPSLSNAKAGAADLVCLYPDIAMVEIECYQNDSTGGASILKEKLRSTVSRFSKLYDWEWRGSTGLHLINIPRVAN